MSKKKTKATMSESKSSESRCLKSEHWVLPAAILNIFWEDVYPKIVPLIWESISDPNRRLTPGSFISAPDYLICGTHTETRGREIIIKAIDILLDSTFNQLDNSAPHKFSPETKAQFELVKDYLNGDFTAHGFPPVPIYFFQTTAVGNCHKQESWGYDFILSSVGLDIPVPPNPFTIPTGLNNTNRLKEIYYKYAFRRISVPPVVLAPGATRSSYMIENYPRLPDEFAASDPLLDYKKTVYWRGAVSTGSNYTTGLPPQLMLTDAQRTAHGYPPSTEEEPEKEKEKEFICKSKTCWMMTSSLYAKIMNAHPRIVADIWRNWQQNIYLGWIEEVKTSPTPASPKPPNPYTGTTFISRTSGSIIDSSDPRYNDYLNCPQTRYNRKQSNGDYLDARGLYEDYIEAWLPPAPDPSDPSTKGMMFKALPGLHEFMITEEGFLIPELRSPPRVERLMNAWVNAHGAMPIFTDTGKCHCFNEPC